MLEELPLSRMPCLRIKLPDFLSSFRIERNHAVRRSGEVQHAIHHERRGFKGRNVMPVRLVAAPVYLAYVISPRALQSTDVAAVNLLERREPRAAGIASIESPFLRKDSARHE